MSRNQYLLSPTGREKNAFEVVSALCGYAPLADIKEVEVSASLHILYLMATKQASCSIVVKALPLCQTYF